MIPCSCVVQAGQISAETEAALRAGLSEFTQKAFGQPAEISWLAVPEKNGFTAGQPSTSSIVSIRPNVALSKAERDPLLHELCAIWARETQCTLNEIVGVIPNPSPE